MKIVPLLGRILFALIFLMSGINHTTGAGADYAASAGVPMASVLVPVAGILALLGGLSILLGYKVKYGAWLLVIFIIPVTFILHNFWTVKDPMQSQMQMSMFMKNIALLGGALLLAYFGAGPYSLDNRKAA